MKANLIGLSLLASFIGILNAVANPRIVTDPVADYISRHTNDLRSPEERNEHVLKFEVDADNDGKTDIFLSSEKSSLLSDEYENNIRSWDFYKNEGSGSYSVIEQQKSTAESDVFLHPSAFLFDPQKLYVGSISEIGGSYGLLAMYYTPQKNGVFILAYVLGDGFFDAKNFPNPAEQEAGSYHRDGIGDIPDLPEGYRHCFATPPTQTVVVLPQTF